MKIPLALVIAILSLAISSGTMVYSVTQSRSEIHLDPELERLALGYLQDQEQHRAYIRKVDAANHAAEQSQSTPIELPALNLDVSKPKSK
jgi:hypothetical protein